jgi:hypothetical protein
MPDGPAWGRYGGRAGQRGRQCCAGKPACYRVTNASGEERSRGSLKTLRHIRSERARDEGSERVSQLDRNERDRLGRNNGAYAARGTDAALVRDAFVLSGLVSVRMVAIGMLAQIGIRDMDMSLQRRHFSVMRMAGDMRVRTRVVVPSKATRNHGRSREALQRQSQGQKPHQREPNDAPHPKSLNDSWRTSSDAMPR